MTKATYTPLENGDPIETTVAGIRFVANVPVDVSGIKVVQTVIKEWLDAEGNPRSRGVEKQVPLADVLASNPYFQVDGKAAVEKPKAGRPRTPTTADEYRAHALRWFPQMESSKQLGERWESEKPLREKLGVTDDGDEVKFLRPFYEGRFHELRQAEKAKAA